MISVETGSLGIYYIPSLENNGIAENVLEIDLASKERTAINDCFVRFETITQQPDQDTTIVDKGLLPWKGQLDMPFMFYWSSHLTTLELDIIFTYLFQYKLEINSRSVWYFVLTLIFCVQSTARFLLLLLVGFSLLLLSF